MSIELGIFLLAYLVSCGALGYLGYLLKFKPLILQLKDYLKSREKN